MRVRSCAGACGVAPTSEGGQGDSCGTQQGHYSGGRVGIAAGWPPLGSRPSWCCWSGSACGRPCTNAAARQVDRDSAEQDVWQNARVALANVKAARHSYVAHRRTEARADVAQETRVLREALQFITQHADPDDITFAQQVGTELERYQVATARQLAAVAAGDTAGASNTRLSRMRSPAYPTGRYCTTAPARPSVRPTGS